MVMEDEREGKGDIEREGEVVGKIDIDIERERERERET